MSKASKTTKLSLQFNHYNKLLASVTNELQSGLLKARKALEYACLQTYWNIGKHIRECVEASNGALHLGDKLYARISQDLHVQTDLELSVDTIRRIIQFNKNYVTFPENSSLTFIHYMVLQRIRDKQKRLMLEHRAIEKNMTVADIKQAVFEITEQDGVSLKQNKVLVCERGKPYIYRTRVFKDENEKEELCVDCGFKMQIPLKCRIIRSTPPFVSKDRCCVRLVKDKGFYDVRLAHRKRKMIYTYAAGLVDVIDADTLDALVDVGFYMRMYDRFRLKGINVPEIATPAGVRAKKFLSDYLAQCPRIIIRTTKEGMFGRWIADIFAIQGCDDIYKIAAEGVFVNQLLLDEGHAEIY